MDDLDDPLPASLAGDPIPLDSLEGVTLLIAFARSGRFVLNGYHAGLAAKWGVSTEGVIFSSALPG